MRFPRRPSGVKFTNPMKRSHLSCARRLVAALAVSFLLPAGLAATTGPQTVILNDTFADGERSTQSLPDSAKWFCSVTSSNLSVVDNALFVSSSAGRHAVAYFPLRSIAVGEVLELAFDFSTTVEFADQASGLRFGLFNTNGNTPFSDDNQNGNVTYVGYSVTTNGGSTGGTSNPTFLRKRNATSATQLITSVSSHSSLASGGVIGTKFPAGPVYHAFLRLERLTEDQVRVTATYTGGALSNYQVTTLDGTGPVTAFDTVALSVGSTGGTPGVSSITFDNVSIIHYGPPPPTPPTITAQPVGVTVIPGDTAIFTVAAEGTVPFTYQWRHNGQPIDGATSATFIIPGVEVSHAGDYTVVVTNAADSVTSDPATLTVDTTPVLPMVIVPPFSQTVVSGGSVQLVTRSWGTLPFSYQWKRNGVDLPGATSANLTLNALTAQQAGAYSVVVTNEAGSVASAPAIVTVTGSLPSTTLLAETFSGANLTTQSLPTSAAWFSSSTSSAGNLALQSGALLVPAGRHAVTYFTNSGAQALAVGDQLTASFTVNFSIVGNSSGGLRLGFFNSYGGERVTAADSTNYDGLIATTTGRFPDHNDAIAGPMNLLRRVPGMGASLLGSISGGIYTNAASFSRNNQMFAPGVNYQFLVSIERSAADKLRFTFRVTGGELAHYGFQAEVDQTAVAAFDSFAILSTSGATGSTFTVDNFTVTHTPAPASVAPSFLAQPQSTAVDAGTSVTLTADAFGTPVPTFQWRVGGEPIPGATQAAFTIPTAQPADSGDYDVVISSAAGSLTSEIATVTVASPLTALQTWRQIHFGSADATGDAADLADPDRDGLPNLVEYALGLDPTEVDNAAIPAATAANGDWVFNYTRPLNRPDVTFVVEVSTNLSTWTTAGVTHEQVAVDGETATWQARYPQASTPVLFFRLAVGAGAPPAG